MPTGFIKQNIEEFHSQKVTFDSKIGGYKVTLSIAEDVIAAQAKDTAYLGWAIDEKDVFAKYGHSWVKFGDELYNGADAGVAATPPSTPAIVVAPAVVHPGMRGRFAAISAACKRSPNYTTTIGTDLGIEAVVTPFVPKNGKPVVTVALHTGHPFLKYPKGKFDAAQIYKNSGDGKGLLKYDKAINPTYLDNAELPPAGTAVVWEYVFIFLYQGAEVGTASSVVSVTVKGM